MVYDNGVYRELTEEEKMQILLEGQRTKIEELENGVKGLTRDEMLDIILNGVTVKIDNKDVTENTTYPTKLGYKIEYIYDSANRAVVGKYVKDPDAIGLESNPILYFDGCPLIDNAFYMKDGKLMVYMGGEWASMELPEEESGDLPIE